MNNPMRIRLRQTVPYDLRSGNKRLQLTINALRSEPERVVLGLHGEGIDERIRAAIGDHIGLDGTEWVVDSIVVGDRGTVELVRAT